jgi:hypothetical protein
VALGVIYDQAPPTLFLCHHLVTIRMAIARIGRPTPNRNVTVPSAAVTMTVAMDMLLTER